MPTINPVRSARVERVTRETQITIELTVPGEAPAHYRIDTPVPFLSHMLEALARHGAMQLDVHARGDTHIDDHHTVEDIGLVLGSAIEPTRPSCYEDMAHDVPKFIELYCQGDKQKQNAEQCGILLRIQRDIERLRAEELVKRADKNQGPDATKDYEKAAAAYRDSDGWARKAILNVARTPVFSSDRTIRQYADEIWGVKPVPPNGAEVE